MTPCRPDPQADMPDRPDNQARARYVTRECDMSHGRTRETRGAPHDLGGPVAKMGPGGGGCSYPPGRPKMTIFSLLNSVLF